MAQERFGAGAVAAAAAALVALVTLVVLATDVAAGGRQAAGAAADGFGRWVAGWDRFDEPHDAEGKHGVGWVAGDGTLEVQAHIAGAVPRKAYQFGIHLFACPRLAYFGNHILRPCREVTREGYFARVRTSELGVVLTDSGGNGSFQVTVIGLQRGTYLLAFHVRDGAGCHVGAGAVAGAGADPCAIVFRYPGRFGVTVPVAVD
ncbi:MAG: hypothetical protein KJZ85_07215 [Rhodobacteraceae bacterium]|jgi:hypothetical protein|nr:hypothetical protein [Paracoccaceae bacterium]